MWTIIEAVIAVEAQFAETRPSPRNMAPTAHTVQPLAFSASMQGISALALWLLLLVRVGAQNQSSEVQSLLEFKAWTRTAGANTPEYDGTGWKESDDSTYWSSWNATDPDPCGWLGVTCTTNRTVEQLDLSGWGLYQANLGLLANLTNLRQVDLSSNNLGRIPNGISTLTALTRLDLSQNSFQEGIPSEINSCPNLRYISFEQSQVSGVIPSLGDLQNLEVLLLANNQLEGPFPNDVVDIASLVIVDLSGNLLNGTVPTLSNLTRLVELRLGSNNFTGLDGPFDGMNSLQSLDVSGNQLEGRIPSGLTVLENLKVLDLSQNLLTSISADLLEPKATYISLNLSYNLLSGNVPLVGTKEYHYVALDLSHNNLSGFIGSIFGNRRSQFQSLWLQNNHLSGDIVDILADAPYGRQTTDLRLANNLFSGDLSRLPKLNHTFHLLEFVDLSNNSLHMSISESNPDPLRTTLDFFLYSGYLKELWVGGNNFFGVSLPRNLSGYLFGTNVLEVLDLSSSHLVGEISSATFNSTWLPSLRVLNLSNNGVTGQIPASVLSLPSLAVFDVSNNSLSGQLPLILPGSRLFNRSYFAGNAGLCGEPLALCSDGRSAVPWWVVLIIVAGFVIILLSILVCAACQWRIYHKLHQHDADLIRTLLERESAALMSLRDLKRATGNFADSAQIGQGGFGTVYTGKLGDGTLVAIKRSRREDSESNKEQFLNEVRILSQVKHRHLVKLLGCCMENRMALLVMEFISNGTLEDHLRGKTRGVHLSWTQRLSIAVQTSDALNYLHTAAAFPIYHRDVKSANILLDDNLNAKVADFGISRLVPSVEATHVSTVAIQGTMGYIDPEYYTSYQMTSKSDVYSFGVVLLELISAKHPIDFSRGGDETSLVNFAKPFVKDGDLRRLIDPVLAETYNDPSGEVLESITNVGRLAFRCLEMASSDRPSMAEVWKELQSLWVVLTGTFKRLPSLHEDRESDDIVLLSQSFSSVSSGLNLHTDSSGVQMSQSRSLTRAKSKSSQD